MQKLIWIPFGVSWLFVEMISLHHLEIHKQMNRGSKLENVALIISTDKQSVHSSVYTTFFWALSNILSGEFLVLRYFGLLLDISLQNVQPISKADSKVTMSFIYSHWIKCSGEIQPLCCKKNCQTWPTSLSNLASSYDQFSKLTRRLSWNQ